MSQLLRKILLKFVPNFEKSSKEKYLFCDRALNYKMETNPILLLQQGGVGIYGTSYIVTPVGIGGTSYTNMLV